MSMISNNGNINIITDDNLPKASSPIKAIYPAMNIKASVDTNPGVRKRMIVETSSVTLLVSRTARIKITISQIGVPSLPTGPKILSPKWIIDWSGYLLAKDLMIHKLMIVIKHPMKMTK